MSSELLQDAYSPPEKPVGALHDAVTLRSVVTGIIVILLAEGYITWAMQNLASWLNRSYIPMGLVFPFILLVLINCVLDRRGSRWTLRQAELRVVLGMGLIGSFFPFFGVGPRIPAVIAAPFYFDTPENGWREYLHDHIPSWIALDNEDGAATLFFEGLSPGQSIPWGAWAIPVFWWGTLIGAITLVTLCMMVILRRQWVDNERLEYPLMSVGIRLSLGAENPDGIAHMIRNRGFRTGFILGLIAVMWNVASFFYPLIPQLPTTPTAGSDVTWLEGAQTIWVQFSVYIVGFAYFARVEALLSFWLFFLITGVEMVVFDRLGVGSSVGQGGLEAIRSQGFGAIVMIVLISLYMGRHHLKDVIRKAIKGDPDVDDSNEVLPYRTAVIGMAIGLLYIGGWWYFAGMELKVLVLYLIFSMIAYIGLSRVVAEMGLPYGNISDNALNWAPLYLLGTREIAASTLVCQGFLYSLFATTRGFLGPPISQTLKLASGLTFRRNRFVQVILIAAAIGFLLSTADSVWTAYRLGGYNLGVLYVGRPELSYHRAVTWMRNPIPPDWDRLTFIGSGMIAVLLITILRYRFTGWPLSAVGLALQGMSTTRRCAFPVFTVWLVKSLVIRFGGVQLYRKGQPFVLGMMVGYAFGVFFSTAIDHFYFAGQGHDVHKF